MKDDDSAQNLTNLAKDLGFAWPDSEAEQQRLLKKMAMMAAHWRKHYDLACAESWKETERELKYKNLTRQISEASARIEDLESTLRIIAVWAYCDDETQCSRAAAMGDIYKKATESLEV